MQRSKKRQIFTAVHAMLTRFDDEKAVCLVVCLCVCPSVCQTRWLWHNGRKSVQIFTRYERSSNLVFWEEEWLVGGDPFYLKFWVKWPPPERNRRFSTDIRSYSVSAHNTYSEKRSINTNTSPYALSNEPKTIIVRSL